MGTGKTKGYVLIGLAAVLFGFQGVLSQYLLDYAIEPMVLAFVKTLFGTLCIAGLMLVFRPKRWTLERADLPGFLLYGVVGVALFSFFIFAAIQRTNVTTAITLMYTSGAFTNLLAAFVLKERATKKKVVSVAVTFLGTVLVVAGYNLNALVFDPLGIVYGLLIGLTYGVYNVCSKRYVERYNTWVANLYSVLAATVFLGFIVNPYRVLFTGVIPAPAWPYIIALSFLTYGVAYTLFIQGFKTVEAGRGILVANIEPVVSLLLARAFLGEEMGLVQAAGFVLILCAIVLGTSPDAEAEVSADRRCV